MTIERIIELLNIEHACMLRNAHGDCDRHCEACDLVQDDSDLHEMYTDTIALLKAQAPATVAPKRIELADETKAWLDNMDAVDALNNIADICIDWDGYRTANGLGALINEIWSYARYCADTLEKAQEPVEPTWRQGMAFCGKCGRRFGRGFKYCPDCGMAVKWG